MDDTGKVEFDATYLAEGLIRVHRENSVFRREDGVWVYVAGEIERGASGPDPIKVRRNDPCPCGA